MKVSHLTRGAWIEICGDKRQSDRFGLSHLTRGAWIEILSTVHACRCLLRRTSHEVRGLKCFRTFVLSSLIESHLTRGAWIEIK